MRRYLLVRLGLVIPNIFVLLTLVFLLLRVAPGDPISAALGGRLPPEVLAERRAAAGYDRPLIVQYFDYLGDVLRFDLGTAVSDNRHVTTILSINGGATISLAVSAIIVAIVIGLPLGLLAARYRNSAFDVVVRIFGILTYAAPVFFVGVIAITIFTGMLGWLPSGQQAGPIYQATVEAKTNIFLIDALLAGNGEAFVDGLEHIVMPAVTLGLLVMGVLVRMIRVNVAQTLRDDYVEAARARGIPERRVVFHHAFRNAMVPFVTVLGLQVALLLSGAILTESTFSWPGVGSELVRYINARDYVAVQGIMTMVALAVTVISFVIDLVNALIDPRVRY